MGSSINVKRGEGRTVTFTITQGGVALDVSASTITFTVKTVDKEGTAKISKSDTDFDKTDASSGIITLVLNTTDTDITPKSYTGELKFVWTANSTYKSVDVPLYIEKAVN